MVKMNFNFIKNNYSVQIFSILTVFMILYVRLNINIMPLLFIYALWKCGFYTWLCNTFGKKEINVALKIMVFSSIFFLIIMIFWRITMVMDIFYGDSPRVFEDFTKIKANHYRTKVHPFYVLI